MNTSCNWSGFEFHWTRLRGVCDTYWLGSSTEKSKAEKDGVPTNLPTPSGESSKCYDILFDTILIVIPSFPLLFVDFFMYESLVYKTFTSF